MLLLLFNQYFLGTGTSTQAAQTASGTASSIGGTAQQILGGGITWEELQRLSNRHWSAPKKKLVFKPDEKPPVEIVLSGASVQAEQVSHGTASVEIVVTVSSRQKKQTARAAVCYVGFEANGQSRQAEAIAYGEVEMVDVELESVIALLAA